jgi:hypothetical protein
MASQLLLHQKYEQAADYLRMNMKRKRPRKKF